MDYLVDLKGLTEMTPRHSTHSQALKEISLASSLLPAWTYDFSRCIQKWKLGLIYKGIRGSTITFLKKLGRTFQCSMVASSAYGTYINAASGTIPRNRNLPTGRGDSTVAERYALDAQARP